MLERDSRPISCSPRHLRRWPLGLLLLATFAVAGDEAPDQPDASARQLVHDAVQRIAHLPDAQAGREEVLSQVPRELNDFVTADEGYSSPPPPTAVGEGYSGKAGEPVANRGGVACLGRLARLTVECAARADRDGFARLFNQVANGQQGCRAATSNIGPDPLKPFTANLNCRVDTCRRGQACRIIPGDPSFVRNRVLDKRLVCPITFDEFTYLGECV